MILEETYRGLPQLAVLAKILCLLMVVMCGAVPSTVRSVSLYSTCSRGNVTVYGRTVKSTVRNEHNAPYQKMTTQSEDFSMKLYIFAEKSKRYICFSKRWKVISLPKKRRDERCQFYEIYNGRYLRYRSVVDQNRYIGFNKSGKPMTSPRGRQECYNFIKLNPYAGVERHNDIVSSNKGGMKHRDQLRPEHARKPHPSGPRGTKNSHLLASESSFVAGSSRLAQLATQHRHRHSNSWKTMREEATRRRYESHGSSSSSRSSLLVEAAGSRKY
ncbi:PREDICTED: uncharacterized protein LOC105363672 [Ceratosolen solmsi marchali]|uniref:Uncharacterized protein LOC105363672 n=1 Tax=Ceratosolen solmsi marchali TaxID=326594 RepID=A0AAJ7DX75_9HYME|nr:PREDICTED: uncharacterized protein LOC105363672 [Ceratosolen solmsi marchali]